MKRQLQNKIATSRWALPVTGLVALLIWAAAGAIPDTRMHLPFALLVMSAYAMVQLNNSYALIRVYSRMVSCAFLILTSMASFAFTSWRASLMGLTTILTFILIFRCYQDRKAQGWVFFAFVSIGIGSLAWPQTLLMVPLVWLLCASFLYCLSGRAFAASLLGLILPYWLWGGWLFLSGQFEALPAHLAALAQWQHLPAHGFLTNHILATLLFIVITSAIGSVHFLMRSYQDKIRTRMFFQSFMVTMVYTLLLLLLQPQFAVYLITIMTVAASPIIGHYLALTNTRASNITFFAMLAAAFFIIAYNLCTPSRICF